MSQQSITIRLLGREYRVSCPPGQESSLRRAAEEVERRMKALRNSTNMPGSERLAVLVALNLAHELQTVSNQPSGELGQRVVQQLHERLDEVLGDGELDL
ncbi:cell division protein ZapA [Salinibius halmophilus]|uniref:cell division protein ZapA n=1 Tax=Salinibius halmophilus TaxID=1853216 RepID=UPI000E662F18|nr:cell division protein ZapA [Salinibius halmophilus]